MTAAADRHLLFGLLGASERADRPGPARRRLPGLDPRPGQEPGRPPQARGDLTAEKRALLDALAEVHLEAHGGDVSRRAWPPSPPTAPLAPAWRSWASPRSRPRSPGSRGTRTARPPRPTMTPTAPAVWRSAGRPAMASGSACCGLILRGGLPTSGRIQCVERRPTCAGGLGEVFVALLAAS